MEFSISPELSVRRGREAIDFYVAAFGAREVYRVGGSDGSPELAPLKQAHGWLLGRLADPFGHHWEIGKPIIAWPPASGRPGPHP
jgi:uncharacterized glyoxalase superfamily protein PhnB